MWDLIVSVPDHCLSFYFVTICTKTVLKIALKKLFFFSKLLFLFFHPKTIR